MPQRSFEAEEMDSNWLSPSVSLAEKGVLEWFYRVLWWFYKGFILQQPKKGITFLGSSSFLVGKPTTKKG